MLGCSDYFCSLHPMQKSVILGEVLFLLKRAQLACSLQYYSEETGLLRQAYQKALLVKDIMPDILMRDLRKRLDVLEHIENELIISN